MPTAGPRSTSIVTSEVVGLADNEAWFLPGNATASDDSWAQVFLPANDPFSFADNSQALRCTGFGFTNSDIPPGSTIDGVLVEIEVSQDGDCQSMQSPLVYGGSQIDSSNGLGNSAGNAGFTPTGTDTYWPLGGATDVGGFTSLTQAMVVDSSFGIDIYFWTPESGLGGTVSVDHVRMTIYYTLTGTVYNQSCLATTTPTKSLVRGTSKLARTTSASLSSVVRSTATRRSAIAASVAGLVRQIGRPAAASTAPAVSGSRLPTKIAAASSAPVVSAQRSDLRTSQASSSPTTTAARSVAAGRSVSVAPSALLVRQSTRQAQATSAPVAAAVRAVALARRAASAAVASFIAGSVFARAAAATTSPVASLAAGRSFLQVIQAITGLSFGDALSELLVNGAVGGGEGWTFSNCSASGGKISFQGAGGTQTATGTLEGSVQNATLHYISFTISGWGGGTCVARLGTADSIGVAQNGRKTVTITSTSTSTAFLLKSSGGIMSIDDISVRPVGGPASLQRSAGRTAQASATTVASIALASIHALLLNASSAASARLSRLLGRSLSGTSTPVASAQKQSTRSVQATTAPVATRTSSTPRSAPAQTAPVASRTTTAGRLLQSATASVAQRQAAVARALAAVSTATASLRRSSARSLLATTSPPPLLARMTSIVRRTQTVPTAATVRSVEVPGRGETAPTASLLRQPAPRLQATGATVASLVRNMARSLLALAGAVARLGTHASRSVYLGSEPADEIYVGPREEDDLYRGSSNLFPDHET